MQKIVVGLLFLCCLLAHATEVKLQTIMGGKDPIYLLQVEGFAHERNALQFKFKLASSIHQAIRIERSLAGSYIIKIGPLKDYNLALKLKKKLTAENGCRIPLTNNKKIWNLAGADIRAVIAEISRITGKNFIIDPRVQGKISIVSSTPISDKELYQVFLSMLQVSGFAAIPNQDVIKIIPTIEAKTQAASLLNELRSPPQGDEMMVAVVPMHYVPSEQLIPVLRPLMPQWSSVSAYSPSNMLILSGRANNIKQMVRIIRQVDSSNANGIDIVPLQHALAMDVANTLKDLIKTQGGVNTNQLLLAPDDRSNAILLSGSKTERIRLRLLIAKLDQKSPYGSRANTQVVYLNYLRAEDLAPILAGIAQANFSGNVGVTIGSITRPILDSTNPASSLVSNQNLEENAPAPAAYASAPQGANVIGSTNQSEGSPKPTVQIIAEPNTNSIILNAPASLIRILKSVIAQLDIQPAQLLIEALVVEVDENDLASLGIEWGSTQQTRNSNYFRPGFAIINSRSAIDDLEAQIHALARDKKANILSTPSVVVLDNRQAKILVGKQVSVASTTYPNNANGTTPASPYVTFDRINVALHLYVRPQITRGNGIQLQIDQGNDTLDPSSTLNTANPVFKISSIVTSVHVESGDIVVLGGLAQDSLGTDNTRIPFIGDIPGIGRLFQHNVQNREKRILMVFIKPCILRSRNDSLYVSGSKYDYVREEQLKLLRTQPYHDDHKDLLLEPLPPIAALPTPFAVRTAPSPHME